MRLIEDGALRHKSERVDGISELWGKYTEGAQRSGRSLRGIHPAGGCFVVDTSCAFEEESRNTLVVILVLQS